MSIFPFSCNFGKVEKGLRRRLKSEKEQAKVFEKIEKVWEKSYEILQAIDL